MMAALSSRFTYDNRHEPRTSVLQLGGNARMDFAILVLIDLEVDTTLTLQIKRVYRNPKQATRHQLDDEIC